jgi:hypothetical protein
VRPDELPTRERGLSPSDERIHGTPPELPDPSPDGPGLPSADADRRAEPTARHCWVLTETDTTQEGTWLPGLLLGWEKTAAG